MGLGFLPWERLPAWILGPLMVAAGVFLVLHAESFSWRQLEAGSFIIIGMVVFIYGVKKLHAKSAANVTTTEKQQTAATGQKQPVSHDSKL